MITRGLLIMLLFLMTACVGTVQVAQDTTTDTPDRPKSTFTKGDKAEAKQ